ncbi:MAG: FtsQ-type POTRA domain-containing protein [Ruminococcaceae bacterium]|nr:FtsQ-type POTRA domain-containing protein [Oscillospiraceae bacterium]
MSTKEQERRGQARPRRTDGTPTRRRKPAAQPKKQTSSDVVYQPAQHFSRNRLILRLVTVAAVVIALLLGVSVFFKVENVMVSGNGKYTAWDIMEASGIRQGENLLTISIPKVAARIRTELPYVASVRIGIKLPNIVNIEVVESQVVYAVEAEDQTWWLLDSGGKVVEQLADGNQTQHAKFIGVRIQNPTLGHPAVALEVGSTQTAPDGSPAPVTVTQAQRLHTALQIVQYLEQNHIIGKAASVNVTDMGALELWYGQQYQVLLGDESRLDYKIGCLKGALENPELSSSGILDISFTTWPNSVGSMPFPESG